MKKNHSKHQLRIYRHIIEEQQRFLNDATQVLNSSLHLEQTLDKLSHLIVPTFGDYCIIDIIRNDGSIHRMGLAHGDTKMNSKLKELKHYAPPNKHHPLGRVIETGKSILIPIVTKDFLKRVSFSKEHQKIMNVLNPTSYFCVPLRSREKILGAISVVASNNTKTFTRSDVGFIEELAYRASLAIDNAKLYEAAQKEIEERTKAEEGLQQFVAIIESSHDSIVGMDLKGVINSWNKGAQQLYGYKKEEAIGKNISFIIPKDFRKEFNKWISNVKKGELTRNQRMKRIKKGGKIVYISFALSPIKNSKGKIIGVSSIARDITDQVIFQERREFMIKASTLLSASLDYSTTLQSVGRLIVPAVADWFGVDLISLNGKIDNVTIFHTNPKKLSLAYKLRKEYPTDPKAPGVYSVIRTGKSELHPFISDEMIEKSAKDPDHLKLLKRIGIKSVMIVPLTARNKTFGALTLVSSRVERLFDQNDLEFTEELASKVANAIDNANLFKAEQKARVIAQKTEKELRQAKEQLEIIFKNVADGITVQDASGRLIYANDAAAIAVGFSSADAFINAPLKEIFARYNLLDEDGKPFSIERLPGRRALNGEIDPQEVILYKDLQTGEERWSIVKARPVFDEVGTVQIVINIFHDITDRKLQERKKDEFLGIASHELKTPITSIKAFTQILQKKFEGKNDTDSSDFLSKMNGQIDKLTELVNDLLDVTKISSGKLEFRKEHFTVKEFIQEMVGDFQRMYPGYTVEIQGDVTNEVYADKYRIGQVLANFFTNAVKYAPYSKDIRVHLSNSHNTVKIGVEDFGIGISPEYQKQIFTRFFRVSDLKKNKISAGLGLGLYISSEIIKRHNGKIWVESESGHGSIFYFSLPISYNHQKVGQHILRA